MKLTSFILISAAFVATVSGKPLETSSPDSETQENLLSVEKTKDHRRRVFPGSENSSTDSFNGLGNIFRGDISTITQGSSLCSQCQTAVTILRLKLLVGNVEDLYPLIESTCHAKLRSKDVCTGFAYLFGPETVPILNSTLDPLYICSFLLNYECTEINLPQWTIPLPPISNDSVQALTPPPDDSPRLKVLHITDTHYDKYYAEGTKTQCEEPICCRIQNGPAPPGEKGAGKWGDWNCDIPERTLDNMLEHSAHFHPDIDYIIWTGDIPAHDIWNQSKQSNIEVLQKTIAMIKKHFPQTPVFPAIGNHESAPSDIFPYPEAPVSVSWLYDELYRQWAIWLPSDTLETIRKGAYYTALVKPGFRIVSLNTNYCYTRNWWLMFNSTDPADQLKWLVGVLEESEKNQEKVHIIAHIPPGQDECLPVWKDNYYNITSRFRNTVVSHFFGHTHKDEFEIYYDDKTNEPVGVGYIAPSVTTYRFQNPSYRIYFIDGDQPETTRVVIDYENWVMDLMSANEKDNPTWTKSYSAKSEFEMDALLPKDWDNLYNRLKINQTLLRIYHNHSNTDSPELIKRGCDVECKNKILCTIRSCSKYE